MFIEAFLQDLRRQRFAPRALVQYGRRVLRRVREDIDADPGAVRSVWNVALGFFAAAFVVAAIISVGYDRGLAYDFFLHTALWILPAFGLLTLHIGWLRDRNGYRLSALNLPIILTLVRIVLLPGITLFLVDRHFTLALAAFLLAGLSDVADGWVARRWNQVTPLGTVLDPLIDILFYLALFAGLSGAGLLPDWVFWVAAVRYGILLVGGACLYVFVGPVRIYPTLFGRLSGIVMAALLAILTLLNTLGGSRAASLVPLTQIALGVLLSATVAHVVVLGWYNLRHMTGKASAQGRVVRDVRWSEGVPRPEARARGGGE